MKITNETSKTCPHCGAGASGLEAINKVFGYILIGDEIAPHSLCRECRNEKELPTKEEKIWATSACWGKRINITRTKFDNYLIDLGFLDCCNSSSRKRGNLELTEMGKRHSAMTNTAFRKKILWDCETFLEVVKLRAQRAKVYACCPRCNAHLDTMPNYNHMDYSHKCHRCGLDCEFWNVDVVYDK